VVDRKYQQFPWLANPKAVVHEGRFRHIAARQENRPDGPVFGLNGQIIMYWNLAAYPTKADINV